MILIAGATGALGGMIARRLLERGERVRVLVRPGADFAALREAGAEPVFGDLKEPASLAAAMEGVEVVVSTANSATRGGDDNVQTVEVEGNRNLVDAARQAGVRQLVFVSALGASLDNPVPFMRGKAMAEEYLRASGVPFTILAPNLFTEVWVGMVVGGALQQGRPVALIGEGRRKHSFVSMDDVAAFAVAAVGNAAALGAYIPIGGPLAVSWTEVIETAGQVAGTPLQVRHLSAGDPIPGLPDAVRDLMAMQDTYDSPVEMTETARAFGVSLTPLERCVERMFARPPH